MNALLNLPLELRLIGLFLIGICLGSLVNLAIYRLAFAPRRISPWSGTPEKLARRGPLDRIPILGWLRLRREAKVWGRGFWIRPLLIELATGAGLAALYWWEVDQVALVHPYLRQPGPGAEALHAMFFSHSILILLMLVASFIDFDEQIIPDTVTIPGTLIGLTLATLWPWSLLPSMVEFQPAAWADPVFVLDYLKLTSPHPWPLELEGAPVAGSLVAGLLCYLLWCIGLLPRPWRTRHGYKRAWQVLMARITREGFSLLVAGIAIVGAVAIIAVWWRGGEAWRGLLTALVGMAVGGGIIYLVRVIGRAALRKEAMGFGDVTLMAMIGTLMGWQACLMIFFLAPFAGLLVGIVQLVIRRQDHIPYGPFLCLATLVVMVYWDPIWTWAWGIFDLGWFVPIMMLVCMLLMGILLFIWARIRERILPQD